MDNNKKDQNMDPENIEQTATDSNESLPKFNTGSNDSDYDGGHPKDGSSESKERTDSTEEQQEPKESNSKSFNSGENDSDYDGGHP